VKFYYILYDVKAEAGSLGGTGINIFGLIVTFKDFTEFFRFYPGSLVGDADKNVRPFL
jgi:hypothetical protein